MLLSSLLSLVAILAIAALNWRLGRSAPLTRDRGAPARRIALDLIDFDEREGEPANAGAAYAALGRAPGDLALAVALGDGWVTRRFRPGSLRRVHRIGSRVALHTGDFTLPVIALDFATPERAMAWQARFEHLAAGDPGDRSAGTAGNAGAAAPTERSI